MSHVATVNVEIKDLDALALAAARCGLELVLGQTTYRWYGMDAGNMGLTAEQQEFVRLGLTPGVCEHALRVADPKARKGYGAYEIGVVRHPETGKLTLMWDDLCGRLGRCVRAEGERSGMGKLLQMYAVEAAKRSMARQGINCREVSLPNGSIKLVGIPNTLTRA